MTVRRHLLVEGRVQGVWFRDSCRQHAEAHDVSGWARNLPDGRVEVALEGAPEAVATVEAWCHIGPRHAVVASVVGRDEPPEGAAGFRIG